MKDVIVTSLRIPRATHELLSQVSESRSETVSGFIRRAILKELAALGFLPDDQRRALGLDEKKERSAND